VGTQAPNSIVTGNRSLNGISVGGMTGNGPASDSTLGDFVLRVMHIGGGVNFSASLLAAEGRGEARILSRPVLIAANNESAEILVGSQRPFVQAQRSLATSVATRDQLIQYKDVGTKLTVRPTISSDGYVALAVTQEVNQATTEVQFDAPVISTRTVQTKLIVRDSQTVILGGLADHQRDASRNGVPYLSRLPVIGGLFGSSSGQTAETEFFLFITPRIIRSDEDAAAVTRPLETTIDRAKP
jgi:general secretion pathway protein D